MSILSRIREFFNRSVIAKGGGDSLQYDYFGRDLVTVQKGDTLSGLAKRHLGAASRWREIYDLNRGAIGTNPDKIFPGTVLTLPRKDKP